MATPLPPPRLVEKLLLPVLRLGLIITRQARTLGAIAVVRSGDRVLLVRTWYRSDWGLPGGYLRRREEPAKGLTRELHEETGLEIEQPTDPPMFLFQHNRRHIDFVFTVDLNGAGPEVPGGASKEITKLEWFRVDDLPPLQPEAEAALEAAGVRPAGDPNAGA